MELFCEYPHRITIFAIKAPSYMFGWVICRPQNILKSEAKVEQIIAIVTTRSAFCFSLNTIVHF